MVNIKDVIKLRNNVKGDFTNMCVRMPKETKEFIKNNKLSVSKIVILTVEELKKQI